MDTGTIIAILGISVSIAFGAWGIYLALRNKYPCKLSFVNEQAISLYKPSNHKLQGLEIKYNGEDVDENLVLLNAALINSGRNDIFSSYIQKPVSIKLPDGCVWKDAQIISSSQDMKPTIHCKDNSVDIDPGNMRKNEFVQLQAIAEIPVLKSDNPKSFRPEKQLDSLISFEHRILNTSKIENPLYSRGKINRKLLDITALMFGLATLVLVIFAYWVYWAGESNFFIYSIDEEQVGLVTVTTYYLRENEESTEGPIKLKEIDGERELEYNSIEDLLEVADQISVNDVDEQRTLLFTTVGIYAVLLFILILLTLAYRRHKKLAKIFGEA